MKKILTTLSVLILMPVFIQAKTGTVCASSVDDTKSLESIYNKISEGVNGYSGWWNVGAIGHCYHVYSNKMTPIIHKDELISKNTSFTTADSITEKKTSGFSETANISFSSSISLAAAGAYGYLLNFGFAQITNDRSLTTEYQGSVTKEYSGSYSYTREQEYMYLKSSYNVPSNSTWAIGTVGDYFEVSGYLVEAKNWWGKTYDIEGTKVEFTIRYIIFSYDTVIFSNGEYVSKSERSYTL